MKSLGKVLEYPLRFFESFPPSHLSNPNKFDYVRFVVGFGSQCLRVVSATSVLIDYFQNGKKISWTPLLGSSLFCCYRLLSSYDCTHWASVSTSSTINTSIRINSVNVALCNCSYRALWQASSTCCAVFCNSVSHFVNI